MMIELTKSEYEMIRDSVYYTKRTFENYEGYPSREFKLQRIREVDALIEKLREAWNSTK